MKYTARTITPRTRPFTADDPVRKIIASQYGKHGAPHRGHVIRATPSGPGIPAQVFVAWDDGEQCWERQKDLV